MEQGKNSLYMVLKDMFAIFIIAIITALFVIILHYSGHEETVSRYSVKNGWLTESGQEVSLDSPPKGTVKLTHSLEGIETDNKSLCMKSSDTFIRVSFDGSEKYVFEPEFPSIIGRSYGLKVHTIPVPQGAKEITLTLIPIYEGGSAALNTAFIEAPENYMIDVYGQGLPAFSICLVMAVFGLMMIVFGIMERKLVYGQSMGFVPFGVFAVTIGLWSVNDTYVLQTFTGHPEIIKIMCYICIMFIAYSPVSFVASVSGQNKNLFLSILTVLIITNFVLTTTLAAFGLCDPHDMLLFSHINVVTAMVMTVIFMVRAIREKTIEKQFLTTIIIGMSAAILGVGIDILRFWLFKNNESGSSVFTRIGVLIFIIADGTYLLKKQNRIIIEQSKAEAVKKMAYTDALTGIANRAAYHEREAQLRKEPEKCIIVLLDINFLKTVNDEYGHAEGDKHIKAAAEAISGSLCGLGVCYRIGGDEFAAILDTDNTDTIRKALEKMEEAEEAYNSAETPPVSLQIAYGYEVYDPQKMTLEAAEGTADKRMYDMKKRMKASLSQKQGVTNI